MGAVAIKPYITTGVPELGIPAADPLILDEIAFDLKNPIIDVHVEFTDNAVTGLAQHELIDINADKEARTIEMSMFIPYSKSVGQYVIEAKLLFFNWKLMTPLPMSLSSPTPPSLARPSLTSGTTGLLLTKILTSLLMLAVSTSKWRICSTAKLINLPRLSTSSSTRTLTSSSRTSSLPLPSPSLASSRVSTTVLSGTLMLVYSNSSHYHQYYQYQTICI